MASKADVWIERIKAVEQEYYAARFSVRRTLAQARADPTILTGKLRVQEIGRTAESLEGTYIIRLFSEFESGVRLYFQQVWKRRSPSRTEDLLNSVAARRRIPASQLSNVHKVREYRNELVHERYKDSAPISIKEARSHLCYYLSFLPRDW